MTTENGRRAFLGGAASAAWLASTAAGAAPAGAVDSGKFKRTSFVRRRFDMTHAQFVDHWRNVHAVINAKTVGMQRYALNMVDLRRVPNTPFDGVAQVWYANAEAADFSTRDPANAPVRAEVGPDVLKFLTLPVLQLTTREYVITAPGPGRPAKIKEVVLLKKSAGQTDAQFADYWLNTHARTTGGLPGLRGQTVNIVDKALSPNPAWDGYAELWFDDFAAYDAAARSPVRDELARERAQFTTPDARVPLVTEEMLIPLAPLGRA